MVVFDVKLCFTFGIFSHLTLFNFIFVAAKKNAPHGGRLSIMATEKVKFGIICQRLGDQTGHGGLK